MIKIEILEASDPYLIGIYEYKFNSLFIGRSLKSDIIILDSEMPLKFLEIKFVSNKLVIQNFPDTPFYFVNDKKMSGIRKLAINDVICFGKNKFRILEAFQNEESSNQKDLSFYYENFQKNTPEMKFILDFLEEEIINLENKNV